MLAAVNYLFAGAFGDEYQPLAASAEFADPVFGHPVELLVTDKSSYRGSGEHWRHGEARAIAARVRELVDRRTWARRYSTINRFEQQLAAGGAVVVKCFLHISPEEQRERLLARLDDPTKHWKYRPGDLDDRALWGAFQEAYGDAIERCNHDAAPWYVVPADRKWYRNWAISNLLLERLEELGLGWPAAKFDVAAEKARVSA